MFNPTSDEVRAFFAGARRKRGAGGVLTPLETIAADWIAAHPEYHARIDALADAAPGAAGARPGPLPEDEAAGPGENPFLHLSMHLSISEQLQIDQPPGLRAAYETLAARLGSGHAAQHEIMECLGEVLWRAQRDGTPPDGAAYLDCVRRRAGR